MTEYAPGTIYYKATRPDGWDFYTGKTINYAEAVGETVTVPGEHSGRACCSPSVLHAADVPTETLTGASWPCRLFEVTGTPVAQDGHKYGFVSLRVEREIEAWRALGPQGRQMAALIEAAGRLTATQAVELSAAWSAARNAAGDAARSAARNAAWDAARSAAAAWDAITGLLVRDLIGTHYDMLTRAWREVIGPLHEDDVDLRPVGAGA